MSVKSDTWIRRMALEQRMIEPFVDGQVREGVISYGLSSYGYDIRISDEFKIFTNVHSAVVDPKHFNPKSFVDFRGDVCVIPPNSFVLAQTVEYFRIPHQGGHPALARPEPRRPQPRLPAEQVARRTVPCRAVASRAAVRWAAYRIRGEHRDGRGPGTVSG